jgi:hypothetical protein
MGCDIHAVFQARDPETGEWRDIEHEYDEQRHYALFGVLAGVRDSEFDPIAEPRGFPDDFSSTDDGDHLLPGPLFDSPWRREHWEDPEDRLKFMGDHNYSCLHADEMMAWFVRQDAETIRRFEYFFHEVNRLRLKHGDVRMVFGFDS